MHLEFQNYIDEAPVPVADQFSQACRNDGVTISVWKDVWLKQAAENRKKFGPFRDRSIGKFHGTKKLQPAIVAGAGPSLKYNGDKLKERAGIPLVSCLHNFHFLEDHGAAPEFYMTLDAGPVTIEEVSEGGLRSPEEYWALTKDRTLLAFVSTHPELLAKWQGEICFYNAPIPNAEVQKGMDEIEKFHTFISNGGNVLGACLYFAKAYLGCNPIAFVGADFSFSYDKKFHGWNSKYDNKLGQFLRHFDVFGNKVFTWQSYYNFKGWFEFVCRSVPGVYLNCTEGGILGSYAEGNIRQIPQMELEKFLEMHRMHEIVQSQIDNPEVGYHELKLAF